MRRTLAAVIALLALVLAGCGGGPHLSQDPPAHPVVALHAPTPEPQSAMGSVAPPGWGAPLQGLGALRPAVAQTAEMYDSVNVSQIPTGAKYVAGYADGAFTNAVTMANLSWHPHVITVAVFTSGRAHCGDFEPGDMSPDEAPAWYHAEVAAGFTKPCFYSSIWEFVHELTPALVAAHIPRSAYWAWDADYTFVQHMDAGYDATQWTDKALGRNLDESTATLAFLGVAPPKPQPNPLLPRWRRALAATQKALATVNAELAHLRRTQAILTQREHWFAGRIAKAH